MLRLSRKKFKFKSNKKKETIKLFENKSDFIERELISGAHIEMFSNKQISIEGCEGVLDYRDEIIRLKINKSIMMICGTDFDIVSFEEKKIIVKGTICSIEFS